MALLLGAVGFGLYLLYDINSFTADRPLLRLGFLAGTLLIAGATGMECLSAWRVGAFSGGTDLLLLFLALAAFAALIYCLFFALPFQQTYTDPVNGRRTYTFGAYALCRHPGVLCFFAMYLFLGLAALPAGLLRTGMIFSLLNGAYAWFQDRVTFSKTFCDYEGYRNTTPFLIPSAASIRRARRTWGYPYEKEETP